MIIKRNKNWNKNLNKLMENHSLNNYKSNQVAPNHLANQNQRRRRRVKVNQNRVKNKDKEGERKRRNREGMVEAGEEVGGRDLGLKGELSDQDVVAVENTKVDVREKEEVEKDGTVVKEEVENVEEVEKGELKDLAVKGDVEIETKEVGVIAIDEIEIGTVDLEESAKLRGQDVRGVETRIESKENLQKEKEDLRGNENNLKSPKIMIEKQRKASKNKSAKKVSPNKNAKKVNNLLSLQRRRSQKRCQSAHNHMQVQKKSKMRR